MPFPLDIATFGVRYPEFATAIAEREALVQAKLDEAALEIDSTVWGARAEFGHGHLAAHLLAMSSPFAQSAGLRTADGKTSIYWAPYENAQRIVGTAFRAVLE